MTPMELSLPVIGVILVVVIIVFGGARIAGIGKGAGQAIREFRDELNPPGTQQGTAAAAPANTAPVSPTAPAPAPVTDVPDATSPGQASAA